MASTSVTLRVKLEYRNVKMTLSDDQEERFIDFVREHGEDVGWEMFLDEFADEQENIMDWLEGEWPDRFDVEDMSIDTELNFPELLDPNYVVPCEGQLELAP